MPMTKPQFAVPFHRLVLAYDRFAFVKEDDQDLLLEDWFSSFQKYGLDAWERGVDVWKHTRPKFPAQSEMHDLLLDLIPGMHLEDLEREYDAETVRRRAEGLIADQQEQAKLRDGLRRLANSMHLRSGAGQDSAPELTDER